jgi:hypothetical protein
MRERQIFYSSVADLGCLSRIGILLSRIRIKEFTVSIFNSREYDPGPRKYDPGSRKYDPGSRKYDPVCSRIRIRNTKILFSIATKTFTVLLDFKIVRFFEALSKASKENIKLLN